MHDHPITSCNLVHRNVFTTVAMSALWVFKSTRIKSMFVKSSHLSPYSECSGIRIVEEKNLEFGFCLEKILEFGFCLDKILEFGKNLEFGFYSEKNLENIWFYSEASEFE